MSILRTVNGETKIYNPKVKEGHIVIDRLGNRHTVISEFCGFIETLDSRNEPRTFEITGLNYYNRPKSDRTKGIWRMASE